MNDPQLQKVLRKIQDAIIDQNYVMTPHAILEMEEDDLDVIDVESQS